MKIKNLAFLAGMFALVVAVPFAVGLTGGGDAPSGARQTVRADRAKTGGRLARRRVHAPASAREAVREALAKSGVKRNGRPRAGESRPKVDYGHLKGADRTAALQVQAALDAEDLEKVLAASEAALRSDNPEVRGYAVDALGWFGTDALPELTGAMADPDEDVASAAADAWELAVSDLDSAAEQLSLAMATVSVLTNPDQLASISGILSNAADELIDGADDELIASQYRLEIVQALADIIEGDGPEVCAAQAREAYEDITGEEWGGIDAAEDYLREMSGDVDDTAV